MTRPNYISRNRVLPDTGDDIPVGDDYRGRLNDYVNKKFLDK